MKNNGHLPQAQLIRLLSLQERVKQRIFDLQKSEEIKLSLRPDDSVSRGMFKADKLIPGGYVAHPITLRAVRKDIFFHGGFEDLEEIVQCPSCHKELDLQFWIFCPYCEHTF